MAREPRPDRQPDPNKICVVECVCVHAEEEIGV